MNSLATVRSVLGWELHGQFIDPGLTSADDYHLLSGSPSINSGTALGLISDYENKPWRTPPSKGAFEYGAAPIVAPVYQSSIVRAAAPKSLEMTYDLTLANVIPDTSSFKVLINSLARKVDTVSISGTKVLLTLSNPVVYGDIVTISYAKPVSNPLQTAAGGEASSLTAQPVINGCTAIVNSPPYVQITSPLTNSSFRSPATITINAAASDSDGTITRVEFFDGSYKLGERTTAPYSFTWSGVSRGTYKLTAAATDNLNSKTVSAPVTVTVLNRYSGRKGETLIPGTYSDNGLSAGIESADSLRGDSELMTLFPNPNDGHFSISFVTPVKGEVYLLSIISVTGATVYKEILQEEAGIRNYDLSFLKSGMYILQISNHGILVTRKFLIY